MRAAWSASLIVVLGFFLASDLTHRSDRAQLASVSPEPEVAGKKPPKDFFSSKTDGNSSSDLGKEMQLTTNLAASRTNPELAKNMAGKESEARKNELADAPGPEPASPPLENPALAGNQDAFAPSTRARDRKLGLEALASTSATAGTVPAQAPQGAALASAPAFKTKPLPSNVESNTAAAALNPALSVARVEQLRDSIGNGFQNSQQFVAERTGSKKARAAPQAILDQFSLSQQGSQLRVQDLDGSVYLGEVVPESNLPANDKTVLGNRRMASPPGTTLRTSGSDSIARADQFYFQVSGTNRSLNRRVIFRGRVETSNEIEERISRVPKKEAGRDPQDRNPSVMGGQSKESA